ETVDEMVQKTARSLGHPRGREIIAAVARRSWPGERGRTHTRARRSVRSARTDSAGFFRAGFLLFIRVQRQNAVPAEQHRTWETFPGKRRLAEVPERGDRAWLECGSALHQRSAKGRPNAREERNQRRDSGATLSFAPQTASRRTDYQLHFRK